MTTPLQRLSAAAIAAMLISPVAASAAPPETLVTELQPLIDEGVASSDVAVQSWALTAAALLEQDIAFDALLAALQNVNLPVRIAAAQALISSEEHVSEARQVLVDSVIGEDAGARALIKSRILYQLGEETRLAVLEAALDGSATAPVTTELVLHIARRGEGQVYELLERVVDIESADERAIYVNAISGADRQIGLSIAEALLDERDEAKRLEGAEIAFALDSLESRALLVPLMETTNSALAQRIGFHLAPFGDPTALGLARDLVLNAEMPEDLRIRAMALVRDNGAQLVSFDEVGTMLDEEGRSSDFITGTHQLLGATRSPEAIEMLRGLLDGMFADERLLGIAGIGFTGQSDIVNTLAEIVSGAGDQMLRVAAAKALGYLGGDLAAQALIEALRAERVDAVRIATVEALGRTGSGLAPQPIANTLALQEPELAGVALDALLALADASVATQVESAATRFRDRDIRWKATIVLTHLDNQSGQNRLLQALDRPPETFMRDIRELPQSTQDAVDDQLLRHPEMGIREAALFRVMARPDGGYAVLRPFAAQSTPDVRRAAIAVVTAQNDPEDAEIFDALAEDTDRGIRLQGFAAIARLGDPEREGFFRAYLNHADVALRLLAAYALLEMSPEE
jgi:HEAT repeat protein